MKEAAAELRERGINPNYRFHNLMHAWLGGDMLNGAYAFIDPMAWFHHAGGDWLLREWQDRNPQLRATAYGYPLSPAYNDLRSWSRAIW